MYSVDGDFGKVRLASHLPMQTAISVMNYMTAAGWHLCNDKYRISLDAGCCSTWLIFITLRGCGQMKVGDSGFTLSENTVGIIPANAAREYFVPANGEWEFYWMHFGGVWAAAVMEHILACYGHVLITGAVQSAIVSGIEELLFMKSAGTPSFEARASQVIANILHGLLIGLQEERRGGTKDRDCVKDLMNHMEVNFARKVSIEAVSKSLFVNSAHLTRLFKAKTGFTPYEYLLRYRIMKSKELLLYTDLNVKEIAVKTGFPHVSNFIGKFKSLESITPGEFRKQAG